ARDKVLPGGHGRAVRHAGTDCRARLGFLDFAGSDSDFRGQDGLLLLQLPQPKIRHRRAFETADVGHRAGLRRGQGNDRSPARGYGEYPEDPHAAAGIGRRAEPVPPADGRAYAEDRVMVEAQQARLTEFGEAGLVDIASDSTRMQMRRVVERLITAQE